jgi:hypothetical protein
MRSKGTWAWLTGNHRRARRWWEQSLTVSMALGTKYEAALTRLEMRRRLGDRKSLEESIHVFAELGAELDLATARQRLQEIAPHGGG